MSVLWQAVRNWCHEILDIWNRFWFTPTDPAMLSLIRILAGLMLFYTHLVWSFDLEAFMGQGGWVSADLLQQMWDEQQLAGERVYFWSHLFWIQSPVLLWIVHIASLIIFAMFTVGLFSRVTAVLTFLLTVSYIHRASGALFGLDQINAMLALYLMIGPCGARYSIDRWWKRRKEGNVRREVGPTISGNVAIRLIQIHMCVIYFFAGTRKLLGASWWDGSAMWLSAANYEYQSIDLTWLANWPLLGAALTHLTILSEVFYCVLIWNRLSRPVILFLVIIMHFGIASSMGMIPFGLVMIIGNLAFISPAIVRRILERGGSSKQAAASATEGRG